MVINVEKTKIMIIMNRQKWQHLDKKDINASRKTNSKWSKVRGYMGFKWILSSPGMPIYKTHNTIAGRLALLCKIQKYLPYQARKMFYTLPHMDHCSTLWGNANSSERICKLQSAARIKTNSE